MGQGISVNKISFLYAINHDTIRNFIEPKTPILNFLSQPMDTQNQHTHNIFIRFIVLLHIVASISKATYQCKAKTQILTRMAFRREK